MTLLWSGWHVPMFLLPLALIAASDSTALAQVPERAPARQGECVMLLPLDESGPYVSDPAECAVRTAPASTFKIPHALIVLETAVISSPLQMVPWDGRKQPFPAWERDHSLDSAVKSSVLWFFRRTSALIGRSRMLESLKKFGYASDTFERELTSFWLNGDLVVSPREQLEFLRRFARYELPVKHQHVDAVKAALLMPAGTLTNASGTHDFALTWPGPLIVRAKTGNATVGGERVSWLVGLVEASGRQYVFVARVRGQDQLPGTAGADLARNVLNALGPYWPKPVERRFIGAQTRLEFSDQTVSGIPTRR
jgi:beta-lactamase class D